MIALIVADGDTLTRPAVAQLLADRQPGIVVAADGGALKALALGYAPDVVVGDADSLPDGEADRLRAAGAEVTIHPAAKDESDTELALREALARGADELLIVGAFGGARIEHTIANLLLLCMPELEGRSVRLADGASVIQLIEAASPLEILGQRGDFISLLPLSPEVTGVTTEGLAFQLSDETLRQGPARGLSNVMIGEHASVTVAGGRLLAVHTRWVE